MSGLREWQWVEHLTITRLAGDSEDPVLMWVVTKTRVECNSIDYSAWTHWGKLEREAWQVLDYASWTKPQQDTRTINWKQVLKEDQTK